MSLKMWKFHFAYGVCCLVVIAHSKSVNPRDFQSSNIIPMDDFSDEMSYLMHQDPVMYRIQNKVKNAALYTDSKHQQTRLDSFSDRHSLDKNNIVTKKPFQDAINYRYPGKSKNNVNSSKMYPLELHAQYKINPKLLNIFYTNYIPPNPMTMKVGQNIIKVVSAVNIKKFEPSGGYKIFVDLNKGHEVEISEERDQSHSNELTSKPSNNSLEDHNEKNSIEKEVFEEAINVQSTDMSAMPNLVGDKLEPFGIDADALEETESDVDSVEEIFPFEEVNAESDISDSVLDAKFENGGDLIPFDGSGDGEGFSEISSENENSVDKDGRILSIFSGRNATSPICTTPKGEPGHCRRISQCLLSDALNNFNNFLQYLCLIRGARVGVCCPDNPVIEIQNPDGENSSKTEEQDIKQPPEGCGLGMKTRIVGGTTSVPHEWTWMVALMRRNRFYCGGVIINNWYILTAAHCVMGINVRDLKVRLGEYNFNERNEHQEDISVAEIKRHAQFVTLTFQHDIALLKLKRRVEYTKFIGSICLPNVTNEEYSGVNGTVVGWGTVSFGGAASPVLRQVTIPVWKNEDCDKTYSLENINEAFMCAGSPKNGEDACQGDSGGPLMTLNNMGRWEVIGIVSWGRRCGDPTYPGVYTRVTNYLDWIEQNSK